MIIKLTINLQSIVVVVTCNSYSNPNTSKINIDYTLLIIATNNWKLDTVRHLIKHVIIVNQTNNDVFTPLILTSKYGHIEIVKYLIDNIAYVNTNNNDDTLFIFASE